MSNVSHDKHDEGCPALSPAWPLGMRCGCRERQLERELAEAKSRIEELYAGANATERYVGELRERLAPSATTTLVGRDQLEEWRLSLSQGDSNSVRWSIENVLMLNPASPSTRPNIQRAEADERASGDSVNGGGSYAANRTTKPSSAHQSGASSAREKGDAYLCRASGEGTADVRLCENFEEVVAFYNEMFGLPDDAVGDFKKDFADPDHWCNDGFTEKLYCAEFECWRVPAGRFASSATREKEMAKVVEKFSFPGLCGSYITHGKNNLASKLSYTLWYNGCAVGGTIATLPAARREMFKYLMRRSSELLIEAQGRVQNLEIARAQIAERFGVTPDSSGEKR